MARISASEWIGFNCGDIVCRYDDPVHEARIEHINARGLARIRYLDTRWTDQVGIDDLRIVRKVRQIGEMAAGYIKPDRSDPLPNTRPRTVVESPRSKLERELREIRINQEEKKHVRRS